MMNLKYDEIEHYSNLFERITAIIKTDPWVFGGGILLFIMGWLSFYYRFGKTDKEWMLVITITQIVIFMTFFLPLTLVALASGHETSINTLAGKGHYQSEPVEVTRISKIGKTIDGGYKLVSYELTAKNGQRHVFNTDTSVKGIKEGDTVRLATKEAVLVDKGDEVEAIYDNQNSDDIKLSFTPSDMTLRKVE